MYGVLRAGLVLACGVASALALSGGPAAASAGAGTSKSVPGAYGSIKGIKWFAQTDADFRLFVKDTAADGVHAEGRVQIQQGNPDKIITLRVHKAVGKGHYYYNPKAHVFDNHPIHALRIIVCSTGISKGHKVSFCAASPWAYHRT